MQQQVWTVKASRVLAAQNDRELVICAIEFKREMKSGMRYGISRHLQGIN